MTRAVAAPFHVRIAAALCLAASFSAAHADPLATLRANRKVWEAHAIHDYDLLVSDDRCWCTQALGYGPIRVLVRGGAVREAIYEGERRDGYRPGQRVTEDSALKVTIARLFTRAEELLSGDLAPWVTIEYDPTYGFPKRLGFDDPERDDEQWRIVVQSFDPR